MEDLVAAVEQGHYSPAGLFGLYRNVSDGDMLLSSNPAYLANDNKPMRLARDPNCHTNPGVVGYARNFLNEIGGNVVFTLVPHSQSCVRQAAELANALNVELIAPPFDGLTTVDGGGHLDRNGAENSRAILPRTRQDGGFQKSLCSQVSRAAIKIKRCAGPTAGKSG